MATYEAPCITLSYKRLPNDKEVLLDFYPPETSGTAAPISKIPAIVFFHGGGLLLGNRRFLFPAWLKSMYIYIEYPNTYIDIVLFPSPLFRASKCAGLCIYLC